MVQKQTRDRLLWFAGLWLASLAVFAGLAYGGKWLFAAFGRLF